MLKRNSDGLYYVSEKIGRRYELDAGYSIGGDELRTSDICYILDSGLTEEEFDKYLAGEKTDKEIIETFVGFFYGAEFLSDEEYKEQYTNVLKEIVEVYESKIKEEG